MNRSRYPALDSACGAASTATGIRTPALVPLGTLTCGFVSLFRGSGA